MAKTLSEALGLNKSNKSSDFSTLSPQEQALADRLNRLASLQKQAEALGIKDTKGTGPVGFLTGALNYISRPGYALEGLLTGLAGITSPEEEQNPLKRFASGLGGTPYYLGKYIQPSENAGFLEKALLTGGTFAGDVLLDPLTYIGGASAGIAGRAGAAAVEAEVGRAATRVLKPVLESQIAKPVSVGLGTATDVARQAARDKINLLSPENIMRPGSVIGAPTLSMKPLATEEAILKTTPLRTPSIKRPEVPSVAPIESTIQPIENPLIKDIAQAAAGARIGRGGPLAVRQSIEDILTKSGQFSPETAKGLTEDILKNTSEITRGGIGLKLPFVGRNQEGQIAFGGDRTSKMLISTPGAGYKGPIGEGIAHVIQAGRDLYNSKYRSTDFYKKISSTLNGRFGEEYANVVRHYATNGEKGYDYSTFKQLVGAKENEIQRFADADKYSSNFIEANLNTLKKASNFDDAKRAADEFFLLGEKAELPIDATPDQVLAFETAKKLQDYVNLTRADSIEAGSRSNVNVSYLENRKTGRPLTQEEIEYQKARGNRISGYTPEKKRDIGFEVDPVDGELSSKSNREMNELFRTTKDINGNPLRPEGHKVYEEDMYKIAAQEIANNIGMSTRLNYIGDLLDSGLFTIGKERTVKLVDLPGLTKRATTSMDRIGERLQKLYDAAQASGNEEALKKFDETLVKLASNKDTINAILGSINTLDERDVSKVGDILAIIKSSINEAKLASGTKFLTDKQIKKILTKNGLVLKKKTLKNIQETVQIDLTPLGMEGTVNVPKGLSNAFADEAVAESVEKYMKVSNTKPSDLKQLIDNIYSPYYTLFKMFATVGRGTGYHIKNLTGAFWNNDLGGVNASDHLQSQQVLTRVYNTNKVVNKAIDNLLSGKPSGLSGDADLLAKYIVDMSKKTNVPINDIYKQDLANYILLDNLSNIKVGDHTMADVYTAAHDQGIFRDNRRLEALRNDARLSGNELYDHLLDPKYVNLFRGYSKSELSRLQRGFNRVANFKLIEKSSDLAGITENYVRLASFIQGARRYGLNDRGTAAGLFTKALQFDYSDLSSVERDILKNIIPFYTWTRRNVPLQFSSLFYQPGKFNRINELKNEMQNYFGVDENQEELANIIPSFMRDRLGFVSNVTGFGGESPLVMGIETPGQDINRFVPWGLNPAAITGDVGRQITQALNPVIKTGIESATGTSTFTGAPFSPSGTPTPFGLNLGPLSDKNKYGQNVISSQLDNTIKNILPPVGVIQKNLEAGAAFAGADIPNKERALTNMLAMWAGTPMSTLDTKQATGEVSARITKLQADINKKVYNKEIDKKWLNELIKAGYDPSVISQLIEMGYGRPTTK